MKITNMIISFEKTKKNKTCLKLLDEEIGQFNQKLSSTGFHII